MDDWETGSDSDSNPQTPSNVPSIRNMQPQISNLFNFTRPKPTETKEPTTESTDVFSCIFTSPDWSIVEIERIDLKKGDLDGVTFFLKRTDEIFTLQLKEENELRVEWYCTRVSSRQLEKGRTEDTFEAYDFENYEERALFGQDADWTVYMHASYIFSHAFKSKQPPVFRQLIKNPRQTDLL
tara:strand:- start:197 stop:742 length:546 start_codon:yes stop_codon:yes gene_type:complete